MKKLTNVYMQYNNGLEKAEQFSTRKAALTAADNPDWWPNDFNCTRDKALIVVSDERTGEEIATISFNH